LRGVDRTVSKLYEAAAEHLLQIAKQRGLSEASVHAVEIALQEGPAETGR
jgi:hypothetical protein